MGRLMLLGIGLVCLFGGFLGGIEMVTTEDVPAWSTALAALFHVAGVFCVAVYFEMWRGEL